ncbi:MAG: hypothetical protein PHG14_16315, partial [Desulfobacter postgatei]|uniref:hypothetical protein n=1 Tax=Desulfobacter postgatei TaxID=2293 RepID=UPI0023F3416C
SGFKSSIVVSSHACGHLSSLLLEYGRLTCTLFTCPVFGEYYIPSRKSSFSWILKQFIFAFFLKKSNIKSESRKNQVGILIVVVQ